MTSLKLYLIVTHFVNFKHNFPKEIETLSKNKIKWIKEKSLEKHPFLSELPFHIHDWLTISIAYFLYCDQNMANFFAIYRVDIVVYVSKFIQVIQVVHNMLCFT